MKEQLFSVPQDSAVYFQITPLHITKIIQKKLTKKKEKDRVKTHYLL